MAKKKLPVPPKEWWREFDPVYLAVMGVVFATGVSQQTSWPYLALSVLVVWSLLFYARMKR